LLKIYKEGKKCWVPVNELSTDIAESLMCDEYACYGSAAKFRGIIERLRRNTGNGGGAVSIEVTSLPWCLCVHGRPRHLVIVGADTTAEELFTSSDWRAICISLLTTGGHCLYEFRLGKKKPEHRWQPKLQYQWYPPKILDSLLTAALITPKPQDFVPVISFEVPRANGIRCPPKPIVEELDIRLTNKCPTLAPCVSNQRPSTGSPAWANYELTNRHNSDVRFAVHIRPTRTNARSTTEYIDFMSISRIPMPTIITSTSAQSQ